jgi:hypothetical protein
VIRLFNVYYPVRTLVLLIVEALIVWMSFVVGTRLESPDWWLLLNVEGGYWQIFAVTGIVLLLSHWLDLYDSSNFDSHLEQAFRRCMVLGLVAFFLAGPAKQRNIVVPNSKLAAFAKQAFDQLHLRAFAQVIGSCF